MFISKKLRLRIECDKVVLVLRLMASTLMVSIMIAGCGRQSPGRSYQWPSTDAKFDSIAAGLEIQFNDYAPISEIGTGINQLDSLKQTGDTRANRLMKARSLYWHARYMSRMADHDSAVQLIKLAIQDVDSIEDEYDYLRFEVLRVNEDASSDGSEKFRVYNRALNYSKTIEDPGFEAHVCKQMGNLLGAIKEYDRAFKYFDRADSLHDMLGFNKLVVKNGINRALVLENRNGPGDLEMSDSIMQSLIDHPALAGDTATQSTVFRNIYISTGDKKILLRAYHHVLHNARFRHLRGLYRALLAGHNYMEESYDSTLYYSKLSLEDLPYMSEPAHVAHVWLVNGMSWMIRERPDSALQCRLSYEKYSTEAAALKQDAEVLRLNALNDIASNEAEYKVSIFRRNMLIVLISIVVIAVGVILAFVSNRRSIRMRMAHLKQELELEKSKRKVAAAALTIEEKNNVLGALKQELSEMREIGAIQAGDARHLETTIKAHLVDNDSTETFNAMFDVVNPNFTKRLRELSPDLADNYVKLACYILMELDNKRIATLMMIRPESVRQARWRLSRKLQLPEGVTLETFLRDLNARN